MERKCGGDLNLVVSNGPIKYEYRQNGISSVISVLFKNTRLRRIMESSGLKMLTLLVQSCCPCEVFLLF